VSPGDGVYGGGVAPERDEPVSRGASVQTGRVNADGG
jgi:hypothetical protein